MKNWARRVRAASVMGLMWAAAYAVAGGVLARVPGFSSDVPFSILFAQLGFLSGIIFSAILVAIEGRRGFERMSLSRFAGLGAASGLMLSAIIVGGAALQGAPFAGGFLMLFGVPAAASAACAAGSLALARRAERRELAAPGESLLPRTQVPQPARRENHGETAGDGDRH